jgi:succinate dehydrogenase / fumarate reductase cytochrome b subunit
MARPRPLSPHLQVYRLPLPALMSITHRMTGVILSSGTVLLTLYLAALASGAEQFALAQMVTSHILGKLVLFGYTLALFYHACNGVRHLFWDALVGLNIPAIYKSGQAVLVLCVGLTAGLWAVIYYLAA